MKTYRIVMVLAGLFVFGFSTSHAQMMMGQGGKQGMMCEKMGMMGKGGSGMMGQGMMGMMPDMGQGMGMMSERGMMHQRYMTKGLYFYFRNRAELGFSSEQIEKLDKLKRDFKKGYILDRANLKVARMELEEFLDVDSVNMKKVEKKVKEIAALKEKLLLATVKTRIEARDVLTDEQREKAKELMRSGKGSRQMMGGSMGMMAPMGSQRMADDDGGSEKIEIKGQEEHEEHH